MNADAEQQGSIYAEVVHLPPPVPLASVQGSLALDLGPRRTPPIPRPRPRSDPSPETREEVRTRIDAFVRRFLQAAVEISIGDRPVRQVLRHCVPTVYDDLAERAVRVARAAGTTTHQGRRPGAVRPIVVSARTSMPQPSAVEASAHVRYGNRSRAVAARFELMQGRWQCVTIEWE